MKSETTTNHATLWTGPSHHIKRPDAVWHAGRDIVPTNKDTKWVQNWEEFHVSGGVIHFNEDQTELVLTLPEGVKFGIRFMEDK